MTQYNLINNSLVESTTSSGTGNRDLSVDEIRSLYDTNITSSGISLLSTDILYLDINLLNRIDVDDVELYIEVPGDRDAALIKVDFYYKNTTDDSYTLCSKAHDSTAFYPINLPTLFAPQFFRIVIDTLECEVFEFIVTNDEGQVGFGKDGNTTLVDVDHGTEGYSVLEIFNNKPIGTEQVTAYIVPDHKGEETNYYIKLSSTADGEYKGLGDGGLVRNNDHTSKHTWSEGYFNGTYTTEDLVKIDPSSSNPTEAYYTTPVLTLGDPLMSSFLITEQTLISGTDITWDISLNVPTVKIRSSNIDPLPLTKLYITEEQSAAKIYIYSGDTSNGGITSTEAFTAAGEASGSSMKFDKLSGTFIIVHGNRQITRYKFNSTGNAGIISSSGSSTNYNIVNNWGIDGYGNVWGYSSGGAYKLRIFASGSLTETTLLDNGIDHCVTGLAPNISYPSCWFTDPSVKMLKHMGSGGTLIVSKSLDNPTYICSLYDGGCLVIDAGKSTINRYSYDGELLKEILFLSTLEISDISCGIHTEHTVNLHDRFWILTTTGYVFQYNLHGEIVSDSIYEEATSIHGFYGGCFVHCQGLKKTYQLNTYGVVERVWNYTGLGTMGKNPDPVFVTYDEYLELLECDNILPLNNDPVWGHSVEDTWKEVISNGYLLPFSKFHQLKYKFSGQVIEVPILNPSGDSGWVNWTGDGSASFRYDWPDPLTGVYSFGLAPIHNNLVFGNFYQTLDLSSISEINFNFLDQQGQLDREGYMFCLGCYSNIINNGSSGFIEFSYYDVDDLYIANTTYTSNLQKIGGWGYENMVRKIVSGTRYIHIRLYLDRQVSYTIVVVDDFSARITLSPTLDLINIPEPVKIKDISPQEYKNVYIKTEFPVGADYKEYTTDLKCWWGNREE